MMRQRNTRGTFPAFLFFAGFVAVWFLLTVILNLPPYILPSPVSVAVSLYNFLPYLLTMAIDTIIETLVGFALSIVVGVSLAVLVVHSKALRASIYPSLVGFNSFPKSALAPVMLVWFGLGWPSKAVTAFLLSFFPIFVNTSTGLGEVEPDILDLCRFARANSWTVFRKIRLPNASIFLFDGLRIALPLAMVGAIIGEFVGGSTGLGYVILYTGAQLNTPVMFAAIVLVVILSLILYSIVSFIDKSIITWRVSAKR